VETMVMMAGYELPLRAIRQQIASALDMIVHLERMQDGSRRVTTITEVQRMEADVVTLQDLFTFDLQGLNGDGIVMGDLKPTGLRPGFLHKFEKNGVALPLALFNQNARTPSFGRAGS
jgi:pilus assembly protein CpaF